MVPKMSGYVNSSEKEKYMCRLIEGKLLPEKYNKSNDEVSNIIEKRI